MTRPLSPIFQGYLQFGLVFMEEVFKLSPRSGTSFAQRQLLLRADRPPPLRLDLLHRCLKMARHAGIGYAEFRDPNALVPPRFFTLNGELVAPAHRMVRLQCFYDDPDSGPRRAWEWTVKEPASKPVYLENQYIERGWGYVLWDEARLNERRFWAQVPSGPHQRFSGARREQEDHYRFRLMTRYSRHPQRVSRIEENSFDRRCIIWRQGGNGWWEPQDPQDPRACALLDSREGEMLVGMTLPWMYEFGLHREKEAVGNRPNLL